MIIGDKFGVWANVFQSGGCWHFNIFRFPNPIAIYMSRFKDGRVERSDAIAQAKNLMKEFSKTSSVG